MKDPRIALLLAQDLGYCRGVLSGILDYAEMLHRDWVFRDGPPDLRIVPSLRNWKPDGIIAHLFDPELAQALLKFRVPIINVTLTFKPICPVVDVDHEEVGRTAARYFRNKGFNHFGYYGSSTALFSKLREKGFQEVLTEHGAEVSSHHAEYLPQSPWNVNWGDLNALESEWLLRLPKPVAILASNDIPARHLALTCRKLGLRIPNEIAILGVDNDESECRMTQPFLSSISLPSKTIGYNAAEQLDRAMDLDTRPEAKILPFQPLGVIERQSTDALAAKDARLEHLIAWIDAHVAERSTVGVIAQRNGFSKRSLERLFQKELGISIGQFVASRRLENAKSLLRQTRFSLEDISQQSGYTNVGMLFAAFRKHEHLTPTEYRQMTEA